MKWNYEQTSTLIPFWKNNMDNIKSPISNNICAEIKLKVDQQGPTKTIKQCKTKLITLKDTYKKAKDNNVKTGTAPMTCPFYNHIDEILGTRDIVKLHDAREVGVNEDDHINPSGSITKDTENPENIFKVDNTDDEEKDTIGKENIAGGNTGTDHSERETDDNVINHENDWLNSSFIEALNHEKEKRELLVNVNKIKRFYKFLSLHKMNLQMFKEAEERQQKFFQSLIESQRKADAEEWEKEQEFIIFKTFKSLY